MRLLDQVAQTDTPFLVAVPERRQPVELFGASRLAPLVRETPIRYVSEQAATVICTHVALDHALLSRCLDFIRVPAMQLWIEWDEQVRTAVLREEGVLSGATETQVGKRAGMLVRTAESGRAGAIDVCWNPIELPDQVDVAPIVIEFDLDDPLYARGGGEDCIDLHVQDAEEFEVIMSHLRFRARPDWLQYYKERCDGARLRQALIESARAVALDFSCLLATTLLLTAGDGPLARRPVPRALVNRGRARKRQPELLDHIELVSDFSNGDCSSPRGVESGAATRRRHVVRGHLVLRRGAVFWRRSHWRGSFTAGVIASRTVTLRPRISA